MIDGFGRLALAVALPAFLATAALCALVRRYALTRSLLDVPNERSSHSVPTPTGGGIAITLVVVAGIAVLASTGVVDDRTAIALVVGGALVAAVGWLDDRRGLSASARLLVHTAAAAWMVGWLRGLPELSVGAGAVHLGIAGALLAVLGAVWSTNLYNFMDGIDGLAAAEGVVVGLAGALLLAPREPALAAVALLLSAASAGFLVWNWRPARLFMGDVGSGFLGLAFAGLAVASENAHALPALLWLLLLGPFFVDATVTLLRRIARGERWVAAHRAHAYQRAVQAGWSHRRVTSVMIGLSAALGLVALVVSRDPELLGPALATGAAALGALYLVVERWNPMQPMGDAAERSSQRPSAERAPVQQRPGSVSAERSHHQG